MNGSGTLSGFEGMGGGAAAVITILCPPESSDVLDSTFRTNVMRRNNTMQDFTSFWVNYLEYCQRAWLDMARLYTPGLTAPTGTPKEQAKGAPLPALTPNAPSVDAWLSLFSPWVPKGEAEIQPLQPVASNVAALTEAASVSMRVFMPWGGESWIGMLAGQQNPKTPAKQQEPRLTSAERAERAVHDAIQRSKTQD